MYLYYYDEGNCIFLKIIDNLEKNGTDQWFSGDPQGQFNFSTKMLLAAFTLTSCECTRSLPEVTRCVILQKTEHRNIYETPAIFY